MRPTGYEQNQLLDRWGSKENQNLLFTKSEKRALKKEALRSLFYPRRCPFCKAVIGFMEDCDVPSCHMAREKQRFTRKTLDATQHYLGDLAGAAAVYRYEGLPRDAVLRLKYAKMQSAGRVLGNIMAKELFGCTFTRKYGIVVPENLHALTEYHVIVPVPPSDQTRGYHVPGLLAQPLHYALGIPVQQDALVRARFTKRQAGLSFDERFANAAGAFVAAPSLDLTGKQVLLVDDVITTGATVCACAQALYKVGAESVFAVSFAAANLKK